MPNLPTHIDLAYRAAQRLGIRALDDNLGYYVLGSTSPDIRAMTHRSREEYHFAPLSFDIVGDGVRGLFDANPHLLPGAGLDGPTRAFMAGYVTHIVADELWITKMYRPYFGNSKVFEDEVYGKVMDRAAQMEIDRQSRSVVDTTLPLLAQATGELEIGFIPPDTLAAWQQWVAGFVARDFNWERLRFMAGRVANGDDQHPAHQVADEFLRAMPESLNRLFEQIPDGCVDDYREQATERLVQAVGDYLK